MNYFRHLDIEKNYCPVIHVYRTNIIDLFSEKFYIRTFAFMKRTQNKEGKDFSKSNNDVNTATIVY